MKIKTFISQDIEMVGSLDPDQNGAIPKLDEKINQFCANVKVIKICDPILISDQNLIVSVIYEE